MPDLTPTPYWWEAAPRSETPPTALPASADVAVVGEVLGEAREGTQFVVLP